MLPGSLRVLALAAVSAVYAPVALAHIALYHPSMFGFNVTGSTQTPAFPGDNRPVVPMSGRTFSQWWMHGLKEFPPHPSDVLELAPGKTTAVETVCDKGASSYWKTSAGSTYLQKKGSNENDPCPGQPTIRYHTNGQDDLGGCSLAVAYKSDVDQVQPEDFTVFSVQPTCVWTRWTNFDVPAEMPACPTDPRTGRSMCICAWFWVHRPDCGGEENYMTTFQCDFPGATGSTPVAKSEPARRCGADEKYRVEANPSNCTVGAKQPFYWFQKERNNMDEGTYQAPLYLPLYGFKEGAQNDIFVDGHIATANVTRNSNIVNGGNSSPSKPQSSAVQSHSSSASAKPSQAPANVEQPVKGATTSVAGSSTKVHHTSSAHSTASHHSSESHKPHSSHHATTSTHHPAATGKVENGSSGGKVIDASGGAPKASCKAKRHEKRSGAGSLANARSRHHAQRAARANAHAVQGDSSNML